MVALAGNLATPPLNASAKRTTTSGTISTIGNDSATDTITVSLINGETYAVECNVLMSSTVAGDEVAVNLREDSNTGTAMQGTRIYLQRVNSSYTARLYSEYTAVATASKTFVVSAIRTTGTGTVTSQAASNTPAYLTVRQIS